MNTLILYLSSKFIHLLPETRCWSIKCWMYKLAGVKMGKNVKICSSVHIIGDKNLIIGDNVWIGPECFISAAANIRIGSHVNIAPNVSFICGSHTINYDGPSIAGGGYSDDIIIKDGCWICASSTILGSSVIGEKSIVAAGAITKGVYEDNLLLTGILASPKIKLCERKV